MRSAPHPAAKLVEISETESIGAIDQDRIGIRNIETALDDGGRDQHIDFPRHISAHHVLELVFLHLAMADFHLRLRAQLADPLRGAKDGVDPVVQKIDLAFPGQFRSMASRMSRSSKPQTTVSTAYRFAGGVSSKDMSRAPVSAM